MKSTLWLIHFHGVVSVGWQSDYVARFPANVDSPCRPLTWARRASELINELQMALCTTAAVPRTACDIPGWIWGIMMLMMLLMWHCSRAQTAQYSLLAFHLLPPSCCLFFFGWQPPRKSQKWDKAELDSTYLPLGGSRRPETSPPIGRCQP